MTDVLAALRIWRRDPVRPFCIVMLLTIGISVSTVVFVVIENLLIAPLAVDDPEELVSLGRLSYPNYQSFTERLEGLEGMAAFINRSLTLTRTDGASELISSALVTAEYFSVLGVTPVHGRTFSALDAPQTAVLSEAFWRSAWNGEPEVIGDTLHLNGVAVTIIGVMPATFQGTLLNYTPHVWLPLSLQPAIRPDLTELREYRYVPWLTTFARRDYATSTARLQLNVDRLGALLASEYPDHGENRPVAAVVPLTHAVLSPERRRSLAWMLTTLQLAALAVLTIAMMNVAILALAAVESRRDEFIIRLLQGARWWRVVRRQVVEYLMLGAAV